MMKSILKTAILFPILFGAQGCHVSQITIGSTETCAVNGSTAGNCTVAVATSITIVPHLTLGTIGTADLSSTTDGSYTVSASAPSSVFSVDPNGTPTVTLTANTDMGYSSSITMPLISVEPTIAPVNSGDAVYSFSLPNTSAYSAWVQQVVANTNSSMALDTTAGVPLVATAAPGTTTTTSVLTSNSTGVLGSSSLQLTRTLPSNACGGFGYQKCYQNP